jgi:hypothetical protein
MSGYDIGSARLMLAHLGKAAKHYSERNFARQKIKIELSRLKKISTGTMRKYVRELESSIGEAIRKEQSILKHQSKENLFHGDIQSRIKDLEFRLTKYLTLHEMRAQRLKALETALEHEQESKGEKIALIKRSLNKIERIYRSATKDRKHSKKQLASVRSMIDKIKARIKKHELTY